MIKWNYLFQKERYPEGKKTIQNFYFIQAEYMYGH